MMKKITLLFAFLITTIGFSQDPATGPADPPARNAGDVISFYGGAHTESSYTDIAGVTFANFSGSTIVGDVVLGDGKTVVKYTNHLYHGIGGGSYNVSAMTMLHVDVYSPDFTIFAVKLEANNGSNVEIPVSDPKVQGSWNSYDIDLSAYAAVDLANLKWIVPVTYEPPGRTLYLDNVYFYKPAVDPATDATLSDLKVDGVTISGFLSSKINYDYKVPTGTVVVPQITTATTTQGGASRVITQASSIPGAATVVVTASDGITTKTYTVNIIEVGPATAAPTPPARATSDVLSVFSGAYSNVSSSGLNTFAGASWDNFTIVSADDTRRLTAPNPGGGAQYEFFDASPALDLSGFTHAHVDFYVEGPVAPGQLFQLFLINFPNYPSGAGSANLNTSFDVNAIGSGAWYSGDVELSTFGGNLTRDKIALVQVVAAGSPAFGPIYIDNIYFHKNTTLGTKDFEIAGLNVYPNPTKDSWTVKTKNENISSIQVFDILGKNVLSLSPNANEAKIDGTSLRTGLYFAQIRTANGVSSIKLIKN